jgi:hypothetical protein
LGAESSCVLNNGNLEVDCITIDKFFAQIKPTYIKMDIEGSELKALHGARKTVKKYLPVLAICVYHKPKDIWEIPLYINSISNKYRFFLRAHGLEGWELVCYAVPYFRLN